MDYQSKHSSSGKINTQHNKPFKLKKKKSGWKCYIALWMSCGRNISVLFILCSLQQFLLCNFPCIYDFKMHWFKPVVVCSRWWLKNDCLRSWSLTNTVCQRMCQNPTSPVGSTFLIWSSSKNKPKPLPNSLNLCIGHADVYIADTSQLTVSSLCLFV